MKVTSAIFPATPKVQSLRVGVVSGGFERGSLASLDPQLLSLNLSANGPRAAKTGPKLGHLGKRSWRRIDIKVKTQGDR